MASDKPKSKAAKTAFSSKISALTKEGYTNPKQRVAIAYSEFKSGGVKRLKKSSKK